ncbi:MAG: lectin-like domain-containing protein [Verrucomicrobiales bacterium]
MSSKARLLLLAAMGLSLSPQLKAGTFTNNFNSGVPASTAVYGNAVVEATGGVENSGVLKITKSNNAENGGFIIEDLDEGASIYGFDIRFKMRIGGGSATPADGFSVNFAPDLPDGVGVGGVEEGVGSGLSFAFDTYNNGGTEGPDIAIKLGGSGNVIARVMRTVAQITTGETFADVHIRVNPNGSVSLNFKGEQIFENLFFPGYQPLAGRFGFFARTGGLNANHWVDDLQITTITTPEVGIAQHPTSATVLAGRDYLFSVAANNVEGATYQWLKNGAVITGATDASYTVAGATTADNGAKYSVRITGPNNTVTSQEATLSVVDIAVPSVPEYSLDFNTDGATPEGTFVTGTAAIALEGGVENSGVLQLTINENSQAGAFVIEDIDEGDPVYGFTATFKALVGGGSDVPADGFSFNFATNITDFPEGEFENGIGTGISVLFDIYDNGGGEAPAIDIKSGATIIASAKVPISFLTTDGEYADVLIRLQADGTMDVAYKGVLVHNNVLVPTFSSITGGRFALGGRTGGLNANQWIDDLQISTENTAGDLRITIPPVAQTILAGRPVTFELGVNDTAGVTYQWFRNGTAITGATSSSYTIDSVAAADNTATFSVRATRGTLIVNSDPVTLSVLTLVDPVNPQVNFNFDNGEVPAGSQVFGGETGAYIEGFDGVDGSGVLKLTIAAGSQAGSFVIAPLEQGAEIGAITASFDVRLGGGGNPADGFSFNWASDLPDGVLPGEAEEGSGNGVSLSFDTYDNDNGGGEAPAISIKYKGVKIAEVKVPMSLLGTDDEYRHVIFRVAQDGKASAVYNNTVIFNEVQIPNYTPLAAGKFVFAARTGGAFENHWIDNIKIRAEKTVGPLRILTEPADTTVISGRAASFNVVVSDPASATYRWFRNGTVIAGATGASYTTPALTDADAGVRYTVEVSNTGGPVLSREAVVTVAPAISVSNPNISYDFEGDFTPDGVTTILTSAAGGGYIMDGVLHLTDNVNSQVGSFIIRDVNEGEEVSGFTASFKARVGGGSSVPADGFSFVWARGLADDANFGEDGLGSDLVVSFDYYNSSAAGTPAEAPGVDIRWNSAQVATKLVPLSIMQTGEEFVDVFIRLQADGTLDVYFNNQVIYSNLQLPGFSPLAEASFAFGGRTGGLNNNHWIDDIQIATSVGQAAPQISSIVKNGNNVVITWTGGGELQSATSILGPWNTIADSSSPVTVPATAPAQFFRVVR